MPGRRTIARALGERRWPRRRRAVVVGAIFLLAFAVRSLHAVDLAPLLESQEQPGMRMMQRYDEGAAAILRGEGVLFVSLRDPGDTALLARPPGYSLFLAGLYRTLGRGFFLVQLVQNALAALTVALLVTMAGPLVGWRAAAVGGAISAVAPHLAYYSNLLTPDLVCALPLVAGLVLLVPGAVGRRMVLPRALLAGLVLGGAVWLRPNLVLIGVFVAMALVLSRGRRLLPAATAVALGSILAIAPITIRNWVLYREVVPVSINFGIVLWEGLADASGSAWGTRPTDIEVAAEEARLYGDPRYGEWWASPDGIRRDRDRVRRSLAIIRERPLWFAGAALVRMGTMVRYVGAAPLVAPPEAVDHQRLDALWEPGRGRTAARIFGDELERLRPALSASACMAIGRALGPLRPVVRATQRIVEWAALPLVLLGAAFALLAVPRRAALLLVVPVYQLLFQSIVHLEFRYTAPMQHFLFVLAGLAVAGACGMVLSTRKPRRSAEAAEDRHDE